MREVKIYVDNELKCAIGLINDEERSEGFILGFQSALELLSGKTYSVHDDYFWQGGDEIYFRARG